MSFCCCCPTGGTNNERLLPEDDHSSEQPVNDGATEEYDAIVLYDYEAKEAVQLTVYEKDIVRIRKVNQLGWCLALKGDKQGWIPQTYTRRIEPQDKVPSQGNTMTSESDQAS
mmetsp:Transcript_16374/g.40365  ORF Transcript_16374/g.40365 Transcript_16374/m.40365 type:complete len:113 (-) Transcript_16374:282-620(-)|eukprot:CAMPEP_0114523334 /NCGR_PEP_ID=MMETSP0109-20121206/21234_1 /TAXON_ID=29199 /ORGANISM="Chlorarachnion reptans, Strain CCCM449" /LENGTH=112 /DNA_ID=CAMNT_0001704639 /DNA_START=138 /DNA_END=476 /DNA_ORIENTATION=-